MGTLPCGGPEGTEERFTDATAEAKVKKGSMVSLVLLGISLLDH